MDKKRLKRALGVAIPLAVIIIGISYNSYIKMHTFTLSGGEIVKSGETYVIGYITSRVGDTIKLERGKWYRVEGIGELTVSPVNVRIE